MTAKTPLRAPPAVGLLARHGFRVEVPESPPKPAGAAPVVSGRQ